MCQTCVQWWRLSCPSLAFPSPQTPPEFLYLWIKAKSMLVIIRDGQANFLSNRKTTNSWVRYRKSENFLGECQSANHKSTNQIFMINSKIFKFLQNTAQLCLKTVLKVVFATILLWTNRLRALYAISVRLKTTKKIGSPCHNCERSANLKKNLNLQIYVFAICGTYLRTTHLW